MALHRISPALTGSCPQCHRIDGYLNIGRVHYGVCYLHKVYWLIGENVFSGWQEEDDATWNANLRLLNYYRQVEPSVREISRA